MDDYGIIELRHTTLRPGRRAEFARYADTWFPEAFQQLGALDFGRFCARAQPERLAWLRGFADLAARRAVNHAFYGGPVWQECQPAMQPLMAAGDEVLLLRPAFPGSGLARLRAVDPVLESAGAQGLIAVQLFRLAPAQRDAFLRQSELAFACYRGRGVTEAAVLASVDAPADEAPDMRPDDAQYVAWFGVLQDDGALADLQPMLDAAAATLAPLSIGMPELLVLEPTPRSRLRWAAAQGQWACAA